MSNIKIFNTLTRTKEDFVPKTAGALNIYVCGPTVYNYIHIGNARPLCVFDTLRRYFEYRGYKVFFVQNFTDVDDKIIKKANETGKTSLEISQQFTEEFKKDAAGLNVREADMHPKVTESMELIIDIIEKLISKGYAYQAGGDVYFKTEKFEDYGKLSHMPMDDLKAGARIDVGELKQNPMDFALWKAAKENEPFWESPFGKGRPGWHIECSAMSRHYIGDTIDIHGGGQDLIFPHHENEIAQSECATGKPLANYWMHNGMINVDGNKMSKSKNNFFLVREVAEIYGYEPVRFMLLSAHYRSPINYTKEVIESCVSSLQRLYTCKTTMERAMSVSKDGVLSDDIRKLVQDKKQQFIDAMNDDLNTADAIAVIFELVRSVNILITEDKSSKNDITAIYNLFNELTNVLGLLYVKQEDEIPQNVLELVQQRKDARTAKNFALADSIREEILKLGYVVEETRQGVNIKKLI